MTNFSKISIALMLLLNVGCAKDNFYFKKDEKIMLSPVKEHSRTSQDTKYYKDQNENILGVKDTIIVKFNNTANLNIYLKEFNIKSYEEISKNMFVFKVKNGNETINTANALSYKQDIEYAEPNFEKKQDLR